MFRLRTEKKGIGILYFDEEKASKYGALSKGKGSIPTGFVHNIAQLGLNVKSQTETFQFKNWFGDSKVVDENGNPLVVYHGSGTTFWEFKTEFTGLGKNMYKKRKSTSNLFERLRKNLKVAGLDKEPLGDCA